MNRSIVCRTGLLRRAGIATLHSALIFALAATLLAAAAQPAQAQTYSVLYTFCSQPNCADGASPHAGLVLDNDKPNALGKNLILYGTTVGGGSSACGGGCGTVFKLASDGTETVLYRFTGSPDGFGPYGGLVLDKSLNLYGTTTYGGQPCPRFSGSGCGVVFEVTSSGTEKVLYSFTGGADGAVPYAGLMRDAQGNLYGTTYWGGSYGGTYGFGTVFELTANGVEITLHDFTAEMGDANPAGGLVQDAQGNLYGTSAAFGYDEPDAPGNVFELTFAGTYETLYAFTGGKDGGTPYDGLVRDDKGNLYGTTSSGGAYGGGVVFKVTPSGKKKVLYNFCSQANCADGGRPVAGLVWDARGNLYGTTSKGGAFGVGTVFELTSTGTEKVLYSFTGGADGAYPYAGLMRDGQGNLYGTTVGGGNLSGCQGGCGVVFKVTP